MFLRRSFAATAPAFVATRGLGSLLKAGEANAVDPNGLREFSVVYTDRAINHMSKSFQTTMNEINVELKSVYKADQTVLIPGSGTYGMEAVARQFATGKKVLVIRNGWFSYRWTQIFESLGICADHSVMKAEFAEACPEGKPHTAQPTLQPVPIEKAVAQILAEKPAVVFAPHVETSAGIVLTTEYMTKLAAAVHEVGGLFVLDGVASGTAWIDMKALGVDVYITAPQKGWSGPACAGIVMLNDNALKVMETTSSTSFVVDLKKWNQVANSYYNGAHMYHATMPTDGIAKFNEIIKISKEIGYDKLNDACWELGKKAVELLESKNVTVLAAPGFRAPGVIVAYTDDKEISTGKKFIQNGVQIAGGVPLMVGECPHFTGTTFRLGLFGLDKLLHVDATIADLDKALTIVLKK